MGPIWGRQDPGGPRVGPMNFAIWETYSQVRGPIYHDVIYGTVITVTESESDFTLKTDTPYLALTGELCGVYCKDFREN